MYIKLSTNFSVFECVFKTGVHLLDLIGPVLSSATGSPALKSAGPFKPFPYCNYDCRIGSFHQNTSNTGFMLLRYKYADKFLNWNLPKCMIW